MMIGICRQKWRRWLEPNWDKVKLPVTVTLTAHRRLDWLTSDTYSRLHPHDDGDGADYRYLTEGILLFWDLITTILLHYPPCLLPPYLERLQVPPASDPDTDSQLSSVTPPLACCLYYRLSTPDHPTHYTDLPIDTQWTLIGTDRTPQTIATA